jgi:type IX secretion system PorP/SprF family membrane protein
MKIFIKPILIFVNTILVLVITFGSLTINAQQVPMYTHYMNNTLVVNPGYAGSRDALTLTALYRSQWVGFKGAPVTQTLTLHSPLKNEHIGVGLSILNEKMGPSNYTSVFFDYAYILKLTDKSKLAFGLSAGVNIYQADLNSLLLDQPGDLAFQNNINNRVTPNFGFGVYYSRERFYAGISVPDLLENSYSSSNTSNINSSTGKEQRNYFLIAGSLLKITNNLAFKPTTLVKYMVGAPIQADLTASFVIVNKFLLGAMFRTGNAVGGLLGFDISEQFHLGYSYETSYSIKTFKYNQGSHELALRYDFVFHNKNQISFPRNF